MIPVGVRLFYPQATHGARVMRIGVVVTYLHA